MIDTGLVLNWREAQASHHSRQSRLLSSYAAAYESEAKSCEHDGRRKYLADKARRYRRDAEQRARKARDLSLGSASKRGPVCAS